MIVNLANSFSYRSEVCVYTVDESASFYPLNDEVKHTKIGKKFSGSIERLNFLYSIYHLYKLLNKNKPDVLVSFIDLNNIVSIIVAKLLKIPVIISERSNPEYFQSNHLLNFMIKMLYKRADLLVLQTKGVRGSFLRLNIKLPETTVLPNFLNEDFYREVDFTKKKKIILLVGRFRAEKNHIQFLKALLLSKTAGWTIKIIGDGEKYGECIEFIKQHGLSDKVILEGKKPNVIDYYDEASIFVLPSLFEGFPNVLIEAMSRGCVCLASDCNYGPNEIIQHGHNGFLFEVNNIENLSELMNMTINLSENNKQSIMNEAIECAKKYRFNQISSLWFNAISAKARKNR